MYVLVLIIYPLVLTVLALGAGLLIDRALGNALPASLLIVIGLAVLVCVSALSTYYPPLAPKTPYVLLAVGAIGWAVSLPRVRTLRECNYWPLVIFVLVLVAALAPELALGRVSFSSYIVLDDSAVHMQGAYYLLHYGQSYSHLDLSTSYGMYVNSYYGSGYPSGADTLFGGTALLLKLPLIWSFQPFCAVLLASASAPAFVLARHLGLKGLLAALAATTACLSALVFAYELIASVKELAALPMILGLGALLVTYPEWRTRRAVDAVPFALLMSAGVAALGLAFGAWALGAAILAAGLVASESDQRLLRLLTFGACGCALTTVAAWPTWRQATAALRVTTSITTIKNPGNLTQPLKPLQLFGVWLSGSYKTPPVGEFKTITYILIALAAFLAILGALYLLRASTRIMALWLLLSMAVLVAISIYGTTWANAKLLMLTAPLVMLLVWSGISALWRLCYGTVWLLIVCLGLSILSAGVFVSDLWQYHDSNMAPLARYQELADINTRFAGQGPTLVTDFDEYSIYVLRNLNVSGPDFSAHPAALDSLSVHHGSPVYLNKATPAQLRPYKLILTRRDPSLVRPPSNYSLVFQDSYYDVWRRNPKAPTASLSLSPPIGSAQIACSRIEAAGRLAVHKHAMLLVIPAARVQPIPIKTSSYPRSWLYVPGRLTMVGSGSLRAHFTLSRTGKYALWLRGKIMRAVDVFVDSHLVAVESDQLSGNNHNTMPPITLRLSAGRHRLTLTRTGLNVLAVGNSGSAVLNDMFVTPYANDGMLPLRYLRPQQAKTLCGQSLEWLEVIRS